MIEIKNEVKVHFIDVIIEKRVDTFFFGIFISPVRDSARV